MPGFTPEKLLKLREYVSYDPDTGIVRWLKSGQSTRLKYVAGEQATRVGADGYHSPIFIKGLYAPVPWLAYWFMEEKDIPPGMMIDHINRNRSDNRWCNLRLATSQINMQNRGPTKANRSGVSGVYYNKGKYTWSVRIVHNYEIILLGTYTTFEDAVRKRLIAEVQYFGEITSTHMSHLYDPSSPPVARTHSQWRGDESARKHAAAEIEKKYAAQS